MTVALWRHIDPLTENEGVPTENLPEEGQAPSLGRELRGWAVALVVAVPLLVAEWLFLGGSGALECPPTDPAMAHRVHRDRGA